MVDLKAFRTCLEYREILRILQRSSSLQDNLLWQSLPVGKNVVMIKHFEINFVERGLQIFYDTDKYKIHPQIPIFTKLSYNSSIFKVSHYHLSKDTIAMQLPTQMKTLELRSSTRRKFSELMDKHISLKPSLNNLHREMGSELQVRVIDISEYGIGLLVSEQNRKFFKNNPVLWITKLQNMELQFPIMAEVAYISLDAEYQPNRKTKEIRVGLKLSGVFPPKIYLDFLKD